MMLMVVSAYLISTVLVNAAVLTNRAGQVVGTTGIGTSGVVGGTGLETGVIGTPRVVGRVPSSGRTVVDKVTRTRVNTGVDQGVLGGGKTSVIDQNTRTVVRKTGVVGATGLQAGVIPAVGTGVGTGVVGTGVGTAGLLPVATGGVVGTRTGVVPVATGVHTGVVGTGTGVVPVATGVHTGVVGTGTGVVPVATGVHTGAVGTRSGVVPASSVGVVGTRTGLVPVATGVRSGVVG